MEVADYGVPQFRRRLVLFGGLGFEIRLPKPTHSRDGKNALARWRTVKDAIGSMVEPVTLQDAKRRGEVQQSDWHIVRTLSPENVKRIKLAKAGKTWTNIPETLRPNCHQGGYKGFTNVYGRMEWDSRLLRLPVDARHSVKAGLDIPHRIERSRFVRQPYSKPFQKVIDSIRLIWNTYVT